MASLFIRSFNERSVNNDETSENDIFYVHNNGRPCSFNLEYNQQTLITQFGPNCWVDLEYRGKPIGKGDPTKSNVVVPWSPLANMVFHEGEQLALVSRTTSAAGAIVTHEKVLATVYRGGGVYHQLSMAKFQSQLRKSLSTISPKPAVRFKDVMGQYLSTIYTGIGGGIAYTPETYLDNDRVKECLRLYNYGPASRRIKAVILANQAAVNQFASEQTQVGKIRTTYCINAEDSSIWACGAYDSIFGQFVFTHYQELKVTDIFPAFSILFSGEGDYLVNENGTLTRL